MINKDKLKRLSPEQRIKKLKEMQLERKSDETEIEKLIKESERQAKTDRLAETVAPKAREVDISELFSGEEESLERVVRKKDAEVEPGLRGYIPVEQQYSDYETLRGILPYASSSGGLSEEHIHAIDEIGERLDTIKYRTESKKAAEIHVASIALHHKIRKYAGMD